MAAEPGAGDAADDNARHGDGKHQLEIMDGDGRISIADRLQQADLLAFERDQPAEREIDQEGGEEKEDRRQRAAHIAEHVERVIEKGVRGLVLRAIGRRAAITIQQGIELLDDLALGGRARA